MVIGKVIKHIRYAIKGKFNTIELNDSTCLLFTPLYRGFSPVAVGESILDDATFLNLLIYYNEKYKSFFELNFVDKTFKNLLNQHNTFTRGVSVNDITLSNPQILQSLKNT